MKMQIDHIFICSKVKGQEAQELVDFGFQEGSSRIHTGQGTINRKFYFENFFLEILWVIDETEVQSKETKQTKLWERSQFYENGYSPFGLCLVNSESTDNLFKKSEIYQPHYFPKCMHIDIITNEQNPQLPWTFRLPFKSIENENDEPKKHCNGIKFLSKVEFEIGVESFLDKAFVNCFNKIGNIVFELSDRTHLTLEFDNQMQQKTKEFPALMLTIKY